MLSLFVLAACNKPCPECPKCPDPTTAGRTSTTISSPGCLTFDEYNNEDTVEKKAEWLRKYGRAVCDLYSIVEKSHTIKNATVEETPERELTLTWKTIADTIGSYDYEKYVAFNLDSKGNIISIKLIPQFVYDAPCYSIPLLRGIKQARSLSDTDKVAFKGAKVGLGPKLSSTIIIKVKGISYDYSDEPKRLDEERILNPL